NWKKPQYISGTTAAPAKATVQEGDSCVMERNTRANSRSPAKTARIFTVHESPCPESGCKSHSSGAACVSDKRCPGALCEPGPEISGKSMTFTGVEETIRPSSSTQAAGTSRPGCSSGVANMPRSACSEAPCKRFPKIHSCICRLRVGDKSRKRAPHCPDELDHITCARASTRSLG